MFSDPFTAVMALILLAFAGTLAVFLRIWRELEAIKLTLRGLRENLHLHILDAEGQNRDITAILQELRRLSGEKADSPAAADACLGELLERGLPSLQAQASPTALFGGFPREKAGGLPPGDDEDLLRRLGNGLGTGTALK
jgi:hypothetical protein